MKRIIFGLWFIVYGLWHFVYAQDETLTLLTYYPAPYGVYNNLQIGNWGIYLSGSDVSPNAGYIRFGDNTGWRLHFGRYSESAGGVANTGTTGALMTIQDDGRVGIGTSNPSWTGSPARNSALQIWSTNNAILRLRQDQADDPWNYIEWYNNTNRRWWTGMDNSGNFRISRDNASGNIRMMTGNGDGIFFDSPQNNHTRVIFDKNGSDIFELRYDGTETDNEDNLLKFKYISDGTDRDIITMKGDGYVQIPNDLRVAGWGSFVERLYSWGELDIAGNGVGSGLRLFESGGIYYIHTVSGMLNFWGNPARFDNCDVEITNGSTASGLVYLRIHASGIECENSDLNLSLKANGSANVEIVNSDLECEERLYVYGRTYFYNHVYVNGTQVHDIAEPFELIDKEDLKPGDVVSIDPLNPQHLKKVDKENDSRVAGIISSSRQAGIIVGKRPDGSNNKPLAIAGRVLCNVDAGYGYIETGDLLTASSTPGFAMKAKPIGEINGYPVYPQGCIIGKALEPLKEGKGKILVLVCLM